MDAIDKSSRHATMQFDKRVPAAFLQPSFVLQIIRGATAKQSVVPGAARCSVYTCQRPLTSHGAHVRDNNKVFEQNVFKVLSGWKLVTGSKHLNNVEIMTLASVAVRYKASTKAPFRQ